LELLRGDVLLMTGGRKMLDCFLKELGAQGWPKDSVVLPHWTASWKSLPEQPLGGPNWALYSGAMQMEEVQRSHIVSDFGVQACLM
jgi:hypothetical protein